MNKTGTIFVTLALTLIICGWIANSSIQSHLKTIGLLRSSIIEARNLLESSNKKDIENAKAILRNAQNSLDGNEEDYSAYDPFN